MPVNDPDLDAAAARYARAAARRASTSCTSVSGPTGTPRRSCPATRCSRCATGSVGVTQPYQGHRRMTLTYPALARADQLLWLVTGADKQKPLAQLLAGDTSIPAGNVEAAHSLVLADASAAAT